MHDRIQGTFHFHSTYSHDGRSTLREVVASLRARGLAFCIMTEHFEDFDDRKFDRYVTEIVALNQVGDFVLIPGVEINLAGIDTIVFPALDYAEIIRWVSTDGDGQPPLFRVIAHPSKYSFDTIARHLERYRINAVELWNQQEDGRYIPPMRFLELFGTQPFRKQCRFFFGCDLHEASLTISNVLTVTRPSTLTVDAIVNALSEGNFTAANRPTGIEYCNGEQGTDFDTWFEALRARSFYRGRALQGVRRCLKRSYRLLPSHTQHRLNDIKNYIRNKV